MKNVFLQSWSNDPASSSPCPTSQNVVGKYSDLSTLDVTEGAIVYITSEEKLVIKRAKAWTVIQVVKASYHIMFQLFNA